MLLISCRLQVQPPPRSRTILRRPLPRWGTLLRRPLPPLDLRRHRAHDLSFCMVGGGLPRHAAQEGRQLVSLWKCNLHSSDTGGRAIAAIVSVNLRHYQYPILVQCSYELTPCREECPYRHLHSRTTKDLHSRKSQDTVLANSQTKTPQRFVTKY